jgi:hypothetical protein
MEDIPRNLAKDVKRLAEPRPVRRASRWTLLLVDENGRTIRVRAFSFFAVLGLVLCIALPLAAGTGFYLWNLAREENERLRIALTASAEVLGRESPVSPASGLVPGPESLAVSPSPPADSPPEPAAETSFSPPAIFEVGPTAAADEDGGGGDGTEEVSASQPVEVADVRFSEGDRFDVRFRLRNVASGSEALSGHVVVVLELVGDDPARVAIPEVPLIEGRPTGAEEGQTFSIQNYRPMRFRAGPGTGGGRAGNATAFVFDDSGRLILETPLIAAME